VNHYTRKQAGQEDFSRWINRLMKRGEGVVKIIDGTKETFYQLTTSEWLTLCNQLNLSFAAMKVLMYLRTINPWGDRKVEAETKDLAQALNLNIRTVQRCLHELDDKKLIELEFNRFKFTLKSHTATSTSPDDQNVATSTSPDDQNVAMSRHLRRPGDTEIAKTTSMSRTPSESTDGQGFQETSYSSYSSDLKKDSLSPKGSLSDESGEREISLTLPQEPDAQSTEPDEPETKSNSVKKSNPVKDQSSAPRRDPVENARANYDEPPPWRMSWRVGAYSPVFIDFWLDRMIKKFGPRTRTDAIAAIENAEALGLFGKLQAGWDEFEVSEAKRQATASAIALELPTPSIDLPEAIARLMAEQELTPAQVLNGMRSDPNYKYSMAKVHRDPEVAWAEANPFIQGFIYSYLAGLSENAPPP
jgi:hypothetical protein